MSVNPISESQAVKPVILTIHQYGITLFDGHRRVAVARYKGRVAGWRITGDGLCWLDPRARVPNTINMVNATRMPARSKREAIRILTDITKTAGVIPAGEG